MVSHDRNFKRAKSMAVWSYIGIVNPILGIVLGGISKSILDDLSDDDFRVDKVKKDAVGGIVVSCLCLAIFTFIGIAGIVGIQNSPTKEYNISYVQGLENQNAQLKSVLGDTVVTTQGLQTNYNNLVAQYNQAIQYLRSAAYQPRQPINCSVSTNSMIGTGSISCY